jgi:hypothetical protein
MMKPLSSAGRALWFATMEGQRFTINQIGSIFGRE